MVMDRPMRSHFRRPLVGVAVTNALLLVYGLIRPDSLEFSIPFLIAPSLMVTSLVAVDRATKRLVVSITAAFVVGTAIVLLVNGLTPSV
jgi:hypothetical protein